MSRANVSIEEISSVSRMSSVQKILNPAVNAWVERELGQLNEVQRITIPRIIKKQHTLVMAPTGAGKTLAAFLGIISQLCNMENEGTLEKKIYALYISPLKALNNDIQKNLEIPLTSIQEIHDYHITVAKRTGDTSSKERARLLRSPPHILITTPESLALMLTAPKFKDNLRYIQWLIVDEIHALADNKRGSLLSICIERLVYYLEHEPTRIGLSATVEPPDLVAHYLMGAREERIGIVNMHQMRKLEINVISPTQNLINAPLSHIQKRHREIIQEEISKHRTSLIFTNTRHLAEKMMLEMIKYNTQWEHQIAVHHGSLAKEVRLDVEEKLKKGDMRAVFTSTSLEMGIDIGSIDQTTQIGSPKTVRSFTQRIGRSGHSMNLQSKGNLLVFDRDDLIECMAIARLSMLGKVDRIRIPEAPTDVLFQMLVGMAVEQRWSVAEAFSVINKAYPYRDLTIDQFISILKAAAETTGDDNSWKYALLWYDEEIQEFGRRKKARQAYMLNIGTIPDAAMIEVILESFRTKIGQISDRFAEKLDDQDIFVLGGKTYEYVRSVGTKIIVREAFGKIPTLPIWVGEAQTRTLEISEEISIMFSSLEQLEESIKQEWLMQRYHISEVEAQIVLNYVDEQQSITPLPTLNRIIVEEYLEPSGSKSILVLAIYGRETNLVLAQSVATDLGERLGCNITTIATDNGFLMRLPLGIEFDHHQLFQQINADDLISKMDSKLRHTELFRTRFRQVAVRSLLVLKQTGQRKNSVDQQMKSARWLLKSLPTDYPLIDETIREILYDNYNIEVASTVLHNIENGTIKILTVSNESIPSPMSHSILLNDNTDIILMEDKRSLLLNLHQQVLSRLLPDLSDGKGIFDIEKIDEAFKAKIHVEYTGDEIISVFRCAEFSKYTEDFLLDAYILTGISKDRIMEIINESEDILPWMQGYTTREAMAYHAACFADSIWDELGYNYPEIRERSRELSPSTALEYLIILCLRYTGPINAEILSKTINHPIDKLAPILEQMVRKHSVLKGFFKQSSDEYMLFEDRTLLMNIEGTRIRFETLGAYRLLKMRLDKSQQRIQMSIADYLKENGPVRDTIEFVSRLPGFNWVELRDLLAGEEIYYGRFLGRRLVFIHKDQVDQFILLTRDTSQNLDEFTQDVLLMIQEYRGITSKELQHLLVQPKQKVQMAINLLEQEAYISRIGWDISLIQGGFPNPQYIALPRVQYTKDRHAHAIQWLLKQCLLWYGPLTLQDLLRITRLPYASIEQYIVEIAVISREIFSYLYYGFPDQFEQLKHSLSPSEDVFILSPLDPYFYMISGSFRQEQLPRHTRLMAIKAGKTIARLLISIPDKDILQVLNIQIAQKYLRQYDLLSEIGIQLQRLGSRAFHTQAVTIEEINNKAANHIDNKSVVLSLKPHFMMKRDYLIGGTRSSGKFEISDIIETRLIARGMAIDRKYSSISDLFNYFGSLPITRVLSYLDAPERPAKLLIHRALREGVIHHNGGVLYHPLYWTIYPKGDFPLKYIFEKENRPLTLSELFSIVDMEKREINDIIFSAIKNGWLENISPYSSSVEYRLNVLKYSSRISRLEGLILRVIHHFGPISFSQILQHVQEYSQYSRIEVLLHLATLIQQTKISSHTAFVQDKLTIIYYTPTQQSILQDNSRKHRLQKWKIYENEVGLFESLPSKITHLLTLFGSPVIYLVVKEQTDKLFIEDIIFHDISSLEDSIYEIISEIEQFFFKQGYLEIQFRNIHSVPPKFWIDIGGT
ncbi:MAG: ATP-dependent helicase [Candidatus Heimdallarchaeota archaeon]|nr:ATP-dependent helicase [Candidatus Heimdallarchaeota archaeon]